MVGKNPSTAVATVMLNRAKAVDAASALAAPLVASFTPEADEFLNASRVRARYSGASDMWIWRRLHDGSGFPKPLVINRRRFWRLSDLINWERAQASTKVD